MANSPASRERHDTLLFLAWLASAAMQALVISVGMACLVWQFGTQPIPAPQIIGTATATLGFALAFLNLPGAIVMRLTHRRGWHWGRAVLAGSLAAGALIALLFAGLIDALDYCTGDLGWVETAFATALFLSATVFAAMFWRLTVNAVEGRKAT